MIPTVVTSAGALKTCMAKTRGETHCSGDSVLKQSYVKGNCSLVYEKSVFRKRKYSMSVIIHTKDRKRITKFGGILEGIPCASIEHPRHLLFRLFHAAHNNTVYNLGTKH